MPICSVKSRRSPHGERGLKLFGEMKDIRRLKGRSPHGERGLKFLSSALIAVNVLSLSSRRAWIEIAVSEVSEESSKSRSPHGERGLKCSGYYKNINVIESLSSRRAWIEISIYDLVFQAPLVALLTESVD